VLSFADVLRRYLDASGYERRKVVPIRLPGTAKARAGSSLPAQLPEPVVGRGTWGQFLAETYGRG
jgi:hypothetical protein